MLLILALRSLRWEGYRGLSPSVDDFSPHWGLNCWHLNQNFDFSEHIEIIYSYLGPRLTSTL